jgi:hypothetical protein
MVGMWIFSILDDEPSIYLMNQHDNYDETHLASMNQPWPA